MATCALKIRPKETYEMQAIKVTFSDGDTLETNINGTDEEIRRYYIGQTFNLGSGDQDRCVTATEVKFLRPYVEKYDGLMVCSLTPEWNKRTCNYWYTVTSHATSHTAFNQLSSLHKWMDERGLTLKSELPPHGEHGVVWIVGEYRRQAHMSYDEFYNLPNVVVESKTLSNGDYVRARITQDLDGIRTVHTLNPNCRQREVFNYNECRIAQG